jgi:uncharacterized cofD-like protein
MLGFRWFYPGMRLKRWFLLMALAAGILAMGFSGILGRQLVGIHYHTPLIQEIDETIHHLKFDDFLMILIGITLGVYAIRRAIYTVLTVLLPAREKEFVNIVYNQTRLKRGPRIVCVGGGTGLPNVLYGLKHFTSNLTAVVTVADDGGSSGRLRRDFGTPPPGDIRNCIVALADQETLLNDLFQYRFKGHGSLKGHSFGNLFITVMGEITGDFGKAVEESSKVLATRGTVMPVTFDSMSLQARLKNGKIVTGESNIPLAKSPITEVMLREKKVRPNKEVLKAILEADAIVLGPGSLFTSIIPNLLIKEVAETIALSRAVKIFICNVMTQPGETDFFTVSDHVRALFKHTGPNFVHYVMVNKEKVPTRLLSRYAAHGQEPVIVDEKEIKKLGPKVVRANLLNHEDFVRHNPEKLGKAIIRLLVI